MEGTHEYFHQVNRNGNMAIHNDRKKIENWETMIKPESEWKCEERKSASRNSTPLHAIQCGVDDRMFRPIASESAKET